MDRIDYTIPKTRKTQELTEEEKLEIMYKQYRTLEAEQISRCHKINTSMKNLGLL